MVNTDRLLNTPFTPSPTLFLALLDAGKQLIEPSHPIIFHIRVYVKLKEVKENPQRFSNSYRKRDVFQYGLMISPVLLCRIDHLKLLDKTKEVAIYISQFPCIRDIFKKD